MAALLLMVSLCAVNGKLSTQPKPKLTFLGDEFGIKKPLEDHPITRSESAFIHTDTAKQNAVELVISPDTLTTPNGVQIIHVQWTNVQSPSKNDWIGLYSPSDSADKEYLDYFYADGLTNGTDQLRVWNMRDSYQVRYFGVNGSAYVLQGTSNIATVRADQPLQGHISLTDKSPSEMQIRWVSSLVNGAMVQMGESSGRYTSTFPATHYSYDTSTMCGSSASIVSPTQFRDPGAIYTAIAKDLQPDTTYFYRFGHDGFWSEEHSFTTSSDPESESTKPFQFVMYGDQGTYPNAFPVIRNVEAILDDIDLVLHIGDLSYAWGNGYNWEIWSNMISKIASSVPYMVGVGNHEYDHSADCNNGGADVSGVGADGYHPVWGNMGDDSNGECGAPTYYRFNASTNGNSIFWYSFDFNMVHFIVLSSEHDYSASSPGRQWLENDLKNVDRKKTPWLIVNIHRPFYESEVDPDNNLVAHNLVRLLEPTLLQNGVDMVLAGHYHSYQRTCRVNNYKCVDQDTPGIVHMTIGTGGIGLDESGYRPVPWSEFWNRKDWGFGRFYVNDSTLIAEFVTNDIGVVDSVVLHK